MFSPLLNFIFLLLNASCISFFDNILPDNNDKIYAYILIILFPFIEVFIYISRNNLTAYLLISYNGRLFSAIY